MGKIAVIMSVYRSDNIDALKLAIQSILEQTYEDVDLFIYRDGLLPNELEQLLCSFEYDNKIVYIKNDINKGLAHALNSLIENVISRDKYSYVARMDSDDISYPERFEKQVSFLIKHKNVDVCGTSCREFGASFALDEKHLPQEHDELFMFSITRCPFIHPSVMFKIGVFNDGMRYPIETSLTEDMALWLDLLEHNYIFANLNEVLLDYRLNEQTISRRKGLSKAMSEISIRFKYMFKLNKVTFMNVILILSRIVFHLLPSFFVKIAYKKFR
ncbi:glycosyltransferase [Aliivibrio fischeri]|uniref:glycosyltransferase n=1 Tax=Aliivibrio fischeri TaxID=668 RepID=UPI0012D94C85|nr:glycosyltransferase [Aliivibrio fischeri]MUK26514.1 glycosyltransferase [Aliivibrio fischeri]MUK33724.1 glycosyltransferase [Aliivibrio fischeri]